MTDSEEKIERAIVEFSRRRRVALFCGLAFALLNIVRPWLFGLELPFNGAWLVALWMLASFLVFAAFVWAFRCTICKGWIKIDAVTCSRCGHRF